MCPHMSAWAPGHRNPLYRASGMFKPCCEHEKAQEKAHGHFKSPLEQLGPGYNLALRPIDSLRVQVELPSAR